MVSFNILQIQKWYIGNLHVTEVGLEGFVACQVRRSVVIFYYRENNIRKREDSYPTDFSIKGRSINHIPTFLISK